MPKAQRVSSRLNYSEKESTIERQILMEFMRREARGEPVMFWKVKTTATYDPKRRCFRKTPPWYRKGVPDISGFYRGRAVMIEVKSKNGSLSKEQREFKDQFLKTCQSGFFATLRSVDDIPGLLEHIDKQTT